MKVLRLSIAALLLGLLSQSMAAVDNNVRITHSENLQGLMLQDSTASDRIGLNFEAFGKRFDVSLEPNHRLLTAARRAGLPANVGVYQGEISSMPGSWARLVLIDGVPQGMLSDGKQVYAIESAPSGDPHIFSLADLAIAPGTLTCSDVAFAKNAGELFAVVLNEAASNAALGPGATSEINLAVLGDFEFTSARGSGASAALVSRMNMVDGIFSSQLGVQITVAQIDTFPAANDPFSDETMAGDLLNELANYRFTTANQNAQGLSHLFTGRELDTSTVGVAFGGALCHPRFGAGLTQGTNGLTVDSLVAAHEIGHNFGAPHDGEMGSPCEAEPETFLMAPSVNGEDQFSACSITEMQDNVALAPCISPLPSTDVAVVLSGQPPVALLGNNATLNFEANSVGTDTADNVVVDVSIPAGVTFMSAAADAGSCTSGAGNANCVLGSIVGGSGVTVVVSVTASTVGDADFVATISADVDENANNNQAMARLTTNPAVDLVATPAATAQVNSNQSVTIRPRVENLSSLTANNVTLTITPDVGLRIDSASWVAGTCSIANLIATCQAASLAAQANETLDVQITGLTAGNQSYAMAISSNEADRNTSNNTASGSVNVSAASSGDDGGGGSLAFLSLFVLLFARIAGFLYLPSRAAGGP